ncbi:MAG: acyltransferase family protein, partial [Trebonia sp.]
RKKPRLDHVDAMRPVKQAGVVSSHSLLFFAPGTVAAVGGSLMLLHVTREAFLFISACMLTYGYYDMGRIGYRYFYRRRFITVGVPYLTWTLIYFFVTLPGEGLTPVSGLVHFGFLLGTGYYQLYYLVVVMQFYLVYPALLWLLRRCEGHHLALLAASLAVQVAVMSLMHWQVLPSHMRGFWATREIISYQFYLVAGMVVAMHLEDCHRWLCRNGWKVFWATCAAAMVAETWYAAAHAHLASWLGSASDPLQPIVIPFNIGAIACLYLFGVWLVRPRRTRRIWAMAHSGSDNSYGIYLAQMLFVYALSDLGWRSLNHVVPWPIATAAAVAIVVLSCVLFSSVVARTPLALAVTGRTRVRWSTWLPNEVRQWRAADNGEAGTKGPPAPAAQGWLAAASAGASAGAAGHLGAEPPVPASAGG